MAAAATLSIGVISTICSLFGADAELRGDLDYHVPIAVQGQLAAASMALPVEARPLVEVESIDLGGIRFISISNLDDLHCYPGTGAMPETSSRIATTVLEASLEAGSYEDGQEISGMRQRFLCRMSAVDGHAAKRVSPVRLPAPVIVPHGVKLSLSGRGPVKALPGMRASDAALLGITLDQIRRHLDTQTVEVVTGHRIPNPRAGMMILEGI